MVYIDAKEAEAKVPRCSASRGGRGAAHERSMSDP